MKDQVIVSFPGLGIEEFTLSKIAASWEKLPFFWFFIIVGVSVAAAIAYGFYVYKKKGARLTNEEVFNAALFVVLGAIIALILCLVDITIRWYGLIIVIGMISAFAYVVYRAKQHQIKFDDLLDVGLFTILFGVLGARLYWVFFYGNVDSFYDVIAVWNGGLAIYGGIIGGVLAIFFTCRHKKMKFLPLADMAGPGVMLAQAMGRWGNFFNGEAHGGIVEEGSALYFLRMGLYPNDIQGVSGMAYVHPTFLYESLWNILGFVLINVFYKKKKFDGEVALWYFAWYGFGRMLIEGLRTDSLMLGPFRISQVVGLVCFIAGTALVIAGRIYYGKKQKVTADISNQKEDKETENGEDH